jgi:hypothetical protein
VRNAGHAGEWYVPGPSEGLHSVTVWLPGRRLDEKRAGPAATRRAVGDTKVTCHRKVEFWP